MWLSHSPARDRSDCRGDRELCAPVGGWCSPGLLVDPRGLRAARLTWSFSGWVAAADYPQKKSLVSENVAVL